jgi:hypothetical protein
MVFNIFWPMYQICRDDKEVHVQRMIGQGCVASVF